MLSNCAPSSHGAPWSMSKRIQRWPPGIATVLSASSGFDSMIEGVWLASRGCLVPV